MPSATRARWCGIGETASGCNRHYSARSEMGSQWSQTQRALAVSYLWYWAVPRGWSDSRSAPPDRDQAETILALPGLFDEKGRYIVRNFVCQNSGRMEMSRFPSGKAAQGMVGLRQLGRIGSIGAARHAAVPSPSPVLVASDKRAICYLWGIGRKPSSIL